MLRFAQQVGKGREGKGRGGHTWWVLVTGEGPDEYLGSWCRAAAAVAQSSSESAARGVNGRREGRESGDAAWGSLVKVLQKFANYLGLEQALGRWTLLWHECSILVQKRSSPRHFFFLRLRASINTIFRQQMSNTSRG